MQWLQVRFCLILNILVDTVLFYLRAQMNIGESLKAGLAYTQFGYCSSRRWCSEAQIQ